MTATPFCSGVAADLRICTVDSALPIRSTPPFASTRSDGISIKRNLNEVLPMLATRILLGVMDSARRIVYGRMRPMRRLTMRSRATSRAVRGFAAEEFAETVQVVVRTRDHVDGDDFADRGGGGGAGFDGGFHRGDIAFHKDGDVARADFFPADEFHVGGLGHRVRRFELRDETFGFDHSDCLSSHIGK